jgi:hypothetical protein
MSKNKFAWWKLIVVWVIFLLLHFSYDLFPNLFFRIIAEANETAFFHMKMLFVAYILSSLVEFGIRRSTLKSISTFWLSRALIAVAYPWLAITFWFLAWAVGVTIPGLWEIVYANLTTGLGIYLALRLEEVFENIEFRPAIKWMIVLVFIMAVVSYVAFSLNPPIHFFTTPLV